LSIPSSVAARSSTSFGLTPRSFIGHQDWRRTPLPLRGRITSAAVQTFVEKAAGAIEAGTIDSRDDTTLNWMPISVDDDGWREVAEIMDKTLEQLVAIHKRSSKRLAGDEGIPMIVGLAGFEASRRGSPEAS
jgi:hypothetical protein